jgi:hypothetical protein
MMAVCQERDPPGEVPSYRARAQYPRKTGGPLGPSKEP